MWMPLLWKCVPNRCRFFTLLRSLAATKYFFRNSCMIVALSLISSVNKSTCYICIIYWQTPLHTVSSSYAWRLQIQMFILFLLYVRRRRNLTLTTSSHSYLIRMNPFPCPCNIQIIVIFWVRKGEEIKETRPPHTYITCECVMRRDYPKWQSRVFFLAIAIIFWKSRFCYFECVRCQRK